jgi:hypothetical protein
MSFVRRWIVSTRGAWLPVVLLLALAYLLGRLTSPTETLTPALAFQNGSTTIDVSGTWRAVGTDTPNATQIFCWFPANTCSVTIAELMREGTRRRLQLTGTELDITQLSDVSLTATASTTDPCAVLTLRIDRTARLVAPPPISVHHEASNFRASGNS